MKTYKLIKDTVQAIQYDGSEEMARDLDGKYVGLSTEYDEVGFTGIRATTNDDYHYTYFYAGDYVVLKDGYNVYMEDKDEFELKYKEQ